VFTDVFGLREGDDVRMAGVRVGRVESIELQGDKAKVSFVVQSDQQVLGTTVASVTYQNIVGQRYLGLSLGNIGEPGPLPEQAHLGDFWIPQRGLFVIGRAFFEPLDPARHRCETHAEA
jgi:ABC-type transporter Mla subunit MlaD